MEIDEIREQVCDVIGNTFGLVPIEIPPDISSSTLPTWDSLHHFTLIAALEDRFQITYSSHEIPQMTSLQAITDVTAHYVQNGVGS